MQAKSQRPALKAIVLSVGTVAGFFLTVSYPGAASAQTAQVNPLEDLQTQDNRDPFSSRGNGQMGGVMDLIHNAMLGPSKSMADFSAEQQENLDDAAAQFRSQQQQRLNGQQPRIIFTGPAESQAVPAAPIGTP